MPPPSERKMRRVCVRLWDDNCTKLEKISATSDAGFNNLVRTIVDSYVRQLEALERSKIDSLPAIDLLGLDLTLTLDDEAFDELSSGD